MPPSKMKSQIAEVLKTEGYIEDFETQGEGVKKELVLSLKYKGMETVVQGLTRISKPGLRRYAGFREIPRVLGGLGTAILSTSQGVMAGQKAKSLKLGGEVLCFVW